MFRRESLFDWVDKNADNPEVHFDVAMLLRACDLFSRFSIETMSHQEARALIAQDNARDFDARVLRPADLIESNSVERLQHGIGRFIFKNGWTFRQFSASDYFKALQIVSGATSSADDNLVYLPLRVFDDEVLVLPSGRSLVAQLLTMANHLVIEDADLLPDHLDRHFKRFALDDLSVTDLTGQAKRRGATVFLVEKNRYNGDNKHVARSLECSE